MISMDGAKSVATHARKVGFISHPNPNGVFPPHFAAFVSNLPFVFFFV